MSERDARIVEMAGRGLSYARIADLVGVHKDTVRRIAVRAFGPRARAPVPVTPDEVRRICDLARSGTNIYSIGLVTGRSRAAVMKVLGRAGIKAANGRDRYSAEDRARAVAMVREGATYRAAAEALGMSIGAISGACDRVGLKKREIA